MRRWAIVLSSVMLCGCALEQRGSIPLLRGEALVRGVLSPTDISPVRRGSFLLSQGERTVYYVESPTVDLRQYLGRELLFKGVVEPNNDRESLPVFVVQDVSGDDASSSSLSLSSSLSSTSSFLLHSGSNIPCGGEGGVLCPVGEYCAVESRETNIGRCQRFAP